MSVYNAEKFLPQAIDSILNQSFKDFEFIIVEDCSTDNSLAILNSYAEKDSRIKIIQKQENKRMKGFIENLNIGISEAKGKYIARMDADDIAHPLRFEKQYQYLESNPDIFMVGSAVNFIDEDNKFIKKLEALEYHRDIQKQMPKTVAMYHPVIMFRNKSNIKYRNLYYCEDYDLYLRLINENKKFYNFPESLLDYRILNSSISRKDGNFLRTLFVEKAKSFYKESLQKGTDSYHNFIPEDLLSILDNTKKHSKDDLKFALRVSAKFKYKNEFNKLLKIYHQNYTKDIETKILQTIINLPNIVSKIYFKITQ